MTDWQPINTAPRDGTPVLTYRRAGLMAVAQWAPSAASRAEWLCTDGCFLVGITHWMPLPPGPPLP